jgi:ribosomal protein S18 acetylase RimI-like enzyme
MTFDRTKIEFFSKLLGLGIISKRDHHRMPNPVISIRPVKPDDRSQWNELYSGYSAFYEVLQTSQMRDTVWSWLMDDAKEVYGIVAVDHIGKLIGLTHFRPYARPLSASTGGFLDDLFVESGARGSGAASALISAVKAEGQKRGWTVIRWITAEDNDRARALYDRLAERTKWVTYDIKL